MLHVRIEYALRRAVAPLGAHFEREPRRRHGILKDAQGGVAPFRAGQEGKGLTVAVVTVVVAAAAVAAAVSSAEQQPQHRAERREKAPLVNDVRALC